MIIAYPIVNHSLVNLAAFVFSPDKVGTRYEGELVEPRSCEELLSLFEGWEEEVQVLLKVSLERDDFVV